MKRFALLMLVAFAFACGDKGGDTTVTKTEVPAKADPKTADEVTVTTDNVEDVIGALEATLDAEMAE